VRGSATCLEQQQQQQQQQQQRSSSLSSSCALASVDKACPYLTGQERFGLDLEI